MHPWHQVDLLDTFPDIFSAIVEVPKGSQVKYELDKVSGLVRVDRILYSSVHYPANYGFVPKTYCEDNDPLDVLILGQVAVAPLTIMRVRPIGVMQMLDEGVVDDKIIAVHYDDPEYRHYESIDQLPPHKLRVLQRFFEDYKILENKEVRIQSFLGGTEAKEILRKAHETYEKEKKHLKGYTLCPQN